MATTKPNNKRKSNGDEHPLSQNSSIKVFREYLRIPSVHPDVDYSKYLFLF